MHLLISFPSLSQTADLFRKWFELHGKVIVIRSDEVMVDMPDMEEVVFNVDDSENIIFDKLSLLDDRQKFYESDINRDFKKWKKEGRL